MGSIKDNYNLMFTNYPDLVNVVQLKNMLNIGQNLAYKLVRTNVISSIKIGREYKIPKKNVIEYFTIDNKND